MHEQWQDLISFYVAGTLPSAEARALEQHLATCESCRRSLDEWRRIAEIVRAEAQDWSRRLPPLSPEVRAMIASGRERRSSQIAGVDEEFTVPTPSVISRARRPARQSWNLVALAAALFSLVIFGGALAYLTNQNRNDEREATQVAMLSMLTQTGEATAETPSTPTTDASPPPQATTVTTASDLGILAIPSPTSTETDAAPSNTPAPPSRTPVPDAPGSTPVPQATQPMNMIELPWPGACVVQLNTGEPMTLYRWPDTGSVANGVMNPNQAYTVVVRSENGWYQLAAPGGGIAGWIHGSLVGATGDCAGVNYPTPTQVDSAFCNAQSATGSTVSVRAAPDATSPIQSQFGPDDVVAVLGMSEAGWFNVNTLYSAQGIGWVAPGELTLSGSCSDLPIIPALTTTPTWTPSPQPTVQVVYFRADQTSAVRGDTVILRWETTASRVFIEFYGAEYNPGPTGFFEPDGVVSDLPPSGWVGIRIPDDFGHTAIRFALILDDYDYSYNGRITRAAVSLPLVSATPDSTPPA